jgi:pimeloyl-ACP methyl ester carboxylesterase
VAQQAPGDFVLIGYSMGGLIARDLLANLAAYGSLLLPNRSGFYNTHHVAGLITLGTPNFGYSYVSGLDELQFCSQIAQDMSGYWNPSDKTASGVLSPYLGRLKNNWDASKFGNFWFAAAGTFCDQPWRIIPVDIKLLNKGCLYDPISGPDGKNDGVVCRDSAIYSANSQTPPIGGPTLHPEYPNYTHTRTLLGFGTALVMGCSTPLNSPELFRPLPNNPNDDLFQTIVGLLNGLPITQ